MAGLTTTSGLGQPTRRRLAKSTTPSPVWRASLAGSSKASIGRSDANNISSSITMITAYDRTVLRSSWIDPRLEEQDLSRTKSAWASEAVGRLSPCRSSIDCPDHTIGRCVGLQISDCGVWSCHMQSQCRKRLKPFPFWSATSNFFKLFCARWSTDLHRKQCCGCDAWSAF